MRRRGIGVDRRGRASFWITALAALALSLPMFSQAGPLAGPRAREPGSAKLQWLLALQGQCGGGSSGPSHHPDAAPHDHEHCLRCAASGVIASAPPLPVAAARFSGILVAAGPAIRALPRPAAAASPYRSRAPPLLA